VPAANRSDTTLVMADEDTPDGQLRAYVGDKRRSGDAFDRAGLTDGVNHVIDVVDDAVKTDAEFRAEYGEGTPAEFRLSEVDWDQSGFAQNAEAAADGLTLSRIEDGVWDPRNPSDYYFATTTGGDASRRGLEGGIRDSGGLWRLSFDDIEHPERGGTLTLLLDGKGGQEDDILLNEPDNLGMDRRGNLLIQEDPGSNPDRARIVAYQVHTGELGVVAQFDEKLFSAATPVLTINEESSGIIPAGRILGRGWWLFDAQVHLANANPALVMEGQLLAMRIKRWDDVYR
jgi:secreted PhoX family phosphatase